jgi:hypothetical protein
MSSQHTGTLSSTTPPQRNHAIDTSSHPSQMAKYRRKQVVDGDVVRINGTTRRRRQLSTPDMADKQHQHEQWPNQAREEALQAAMELPSSVLLAQGLRRLLNSDEPMYDVMEKEQKRLLQREFLREVGFIDSEANDISHRKITFPPSPPKTPEPNPSWPAKVTEPVEKRFCECCRARCV